jgi:tetratricopeptide (TPR) repeat protein
MCACYQAVTDPASILASPASTECLAQQRDGYPPMHPRPSFATLSITGNVKGQLCDTGDLRLMSKRDLEVPEASIRLDPFQPSPAFGRMGHVYYMLKRYQEAARWLREGASRLPKLQESHLLLASAYAQAGRLEESRAAAAEVLRINPSFTIESWKLLAVYKDPKDLEHLLDGLRKAGLPES